MVGRAELELELKIDRRFGRPMLLVEASNVAIRLFHPSSPAVRKNRPHNFSPPLGRTFRAVRPYRIHASYGCRLNQQSI